MKGKWHKIEIKQKPGTEGVMTGANTEVFLDDNRLKGVTGLKLDIQANGIAKLQLEILGNYAVAGVVGDVQKTVIPFKPDKQN